MASSSFQILPQYTSGAVKWVLDNLRPDLNLFEYGSGMSSLFYSVNIREMVIVEHDRGWYNGISDQLNKLKEERLLKTAIKYILVEPELNQPMPYSHLSFGTTDETYRNYSFEHYVRAIETYPDNFFDWVIIDGRARASCIRHTPAKVKIGGYVIVDDSERYEYQDAIKSFLNYPKLEFSDETKKTSIFCINPQK
jgi:hypothetical protein